VIGYANDIQAAIVSRLKNDPEMAPIIGGRIYDDVPATSEANAPAFPYVTIGQWAEEDDGTSTTHASSFSVELHIWSRTAGQEQLKDAMRLTHRAFHWKLMTIPSATLNWIYVESATTMRDPDGETYHGIVRLRGRVEYGAYLPR
jgi:hypothetical protein